MANAAQLDATRKKSTGTNTIWRGMLYLSVIAVMDLSLLYFFQTVPLTYSPTPLSPQSPPELAIFS